ncbi:MAG TPA: ATP-grasp domain-containing protein, partial [Candidatus Saccharimonadales bacterium]|nr:ATP-grasp domain-containing protein [Candidatus Saccharimonadales bacterium]
ALKLWGGKLILKSKLDAYDGRGNEVITDKSQIAGAIERFSGGGVYAEKIVDFQKELAVMSAKDIEGNISSYPVVETVHKRNICVEVYAPADISPAIAHSARETASRVVKELEGAGVYGVEMFLDKEENVFINEIAPRVHNSGHFTMDMCEPSQFKQHILAVTGQKLETPVMRAPFCCMVNILGERDGPVEMKGVEEAEKIPGVSVYIYGKKPTKIDRKMGHINAIGDTMETAKNKAMQARKLISI